MTKLLIVESPNKCAKIQSILGSGWTVAASFGHIRDLPGKEIGVAAPDYFPDYEIGEKSRGTYSKLKKIVANCSELWLATDPDREGEAIAWHLEQLFGKGKIVKRVTFNEITKNAILNAIKQPRQVDKSLFFAQQGRRVLDRLFGYKVSPALGNKLNKRGLSAGRVQSVALRIIVERENAVRNFKTVAHFGVTASFETDRIAWKAIWDSSALTDDLNPYITDKAIAQRVADGVMNGLTCVSFTEKPKSQKPPAPLITSTLQQAAANKIKMSVKETEKAAQTLFERGLITYHRTDNPNLSEDGIQAIWACLRAGGNESYIPDSPNTWKAKGDAQEAHEAIRPTDFNVNRLDDADPKLVQLYGLIWRCAVASQMKDCVSNVRNALFKSVESIESVGHAIFKASSTQLVYDGWKRVIKDDTTNEDEQKVETQLPTLLETNQYTPISAQVDAKQTKPPKRFSETALVKALEKKGIGRPSTYGSIISVLLNRQYIVINKRLFEPTELGEVIVEGLKDTFSFLEVTYTSSMESDLDLIAQGKANYQQVVSKYDQELDTQLTQFGSVQLDSIAEELHPCPECENGQLRRIKGSKGFFWGCSNYQQGCKATLPDNRGKPGKPNKPVEKSTDYPCTNCESGHLQRRKGKYGHYWGCDAYPDCKTIVDDAFGSPLLTTYSCPACGQGELKPRQSGKNKFWGCSNYKNGCKFSKNDDGGKPATK